MSSSEPMAIDEAGWKSKYEQLRAEFEEFCTSSKELEAEQDAQLEQSQQENKRFENELIMLKRQFNDLRIQKTAADAEQLRTVTQLRNSLDEAQQKVQQQATYIAQVETEADQLSTHKRVLEQSVRDLTEKVETLEEQRAILETQLLMEKSNRDETVQRLHDRVRELEEDLQARNTTATAFCNNNTVHSSSEAVSGGGDSGFATRMNSTPLRFTPQSSFSTQECSNNNKRSRPSPVGISPPTFTSAGGSDLERHHNGAIKSPRYSSADSPQPQLSISSPLKSSFEFLRNDTDVAAVPTTFAAQTVDDKYAVNNNRKELSPNAYNVSTDNFTAANNETQLNVSSNAVVEYDDECDHGYSSTPTSDKQQSNSAHVEMNKNQHAEADADMEITMTGANTGASKSPVAAKLSSSKDRVSALPQPALRFVSRNDVGVRSMRAGSVDEIQQNLGRKSVVADSSKIQRLMSLSGGLGGMPLSVVNNIDAQALGEVGNSLSSSSTASAVNSVRSQLSNNPAFSSRLAPPPPPPSSSNIAAPATNNNSVHVSWFRSMQLVDKALLKLNSLENTVKQTNGHYANNFNSKSGQTHHFSSVTEKKKISSSPCSIDNNDVAKIQQVVQNSASRSTAAAAAGVVSEPTKIQHVTLENTRSFLPRKNSSEAERTQLAAVNNIINNPNTRKSSILSNAYAAPSNNIFMGPPSSQFSNSAAGHVGVPAPTDRRSKLVAPLPVQQRAGSSSSQTSTLSSTSSKGSSSDQSGNESGGSSSIPAPSKLGVPLIVRKSNGQQTSTESRLRNATAPAESLKTALAPPTAPVGRVQVLRQPTSAELQHQQFKSGDYQQLRQPLYQPNGTAGAATRKQQPITSAVHAKQQV